MGDSNVGEWQNGSEGYLQPRSNRSAPRAIVAMERIEMENDRRTCEQKLEDANITIRTLLCGVKDLGQMRGSAEAALAESQREVARLRGAVNAALSNKQKWWETCEAALAPQENKDE